MMKTLIAPLVAASLAFTPMAAAPAQAGSDDVAKSLAGLALLAIIGSAIAADQAGASTVKHPPKYQPPKVVHPPRVATPPRPVVKRKLPAKCREVLRHGGKQTVFYGKACLEQNMRAASRLPNRCKTVVSVFGRKRQAYTASCLRRAGWST